MANVLTPFGNGFGAFGGPGWQGTHSPALQPVSNTMSTGPPSASRLKRRLDPDDDGQFREPSLDRSPTPERPKKGPPKRARVAPAAKESQPPAPHDDVDIGVLLASLPPEALLPILTALIKEQPSLKASVLPLIPRPALNTAVDALAAAARQLRESYPYSNTPPPPSTSTFGSFQPFGGAASTFGSARPASGPPKATNDSGGGMRDQYILSRLRPHIEKFVAACMSYFPYFSNIPMQTASMLSNNVAASVQLHTSSLQSVRRDQASLSESYTFLSSLTAHIISQPPLTQSSLIPMLLPRLSEEWMAWVKRVDEHVNREAGMFGSDSANAWARGLDEFCNAKSTAEFTTMMQNVRSKWISSVGWLIGRFPSPEPMDV